MTLARLDPDGPLKLRPETAFIQFGVVVVGAVETHFQLHLVNQEPAAIDASLAIEGKDANRFAFREGPSSTMTIRPLAMCSLTVMLLDTRETANLEAFLEVKTRHGGQTFKIPICAVIDQPSLQVVHARLVDGVAEVDLGAISCGSKHVKTLELRNMCAVPYLVQAQSQAHRFRSSLALSLARVGQDSARPQVAMPAHGSVSLRLELQGYQASEDFEGYVLLGYHSSQNLLWIRVKAQVRPAKFEVEDPQLGVVQSGDVVNLTPLEVGQRGEKVLRIRNIGEVTCSLSLVTVTGGLEWSTAIKTVQPSQVATVSLSYRAMKEADFKSTFKLVINGETFILQVGVRCGVRKLSMRTKDLVFKLDFQNEDLVRRLHSKEDILTQNVLVHNEGTLPITIEMQKHPMF
eukprot:3377839-Rhodomonas_salina.1